MRFCSYCGTAHGDFCSYCTCCGMPLPPAVPYAPIPAPPAPYRGKAIAAFILGLLSVFSLCFLLLEQTQLIMAGIPLSIIGLVLGIAAEKEAKRYGATSCLALAGIILSLIGLVIGILLLLLLALSLISLIAFFWMLIGA